MPMLRGHRPEAPRARPKRMKKRYKYPLYTLAALAVIAGGMAVQLKRNIGALPDGSRFEHLPYYRDGQFHAREELPYYPDKATGEGGFIRYSGYVPKGALPMTMLKRDGFGPAADFAYYWLGHASAIMELGGQRILIDPVFGNAAPLNLPYVVPRIQPAPIARDELPTLDAVLITHDHYDHLEADTMRDLAGKVPRFVTTLGVGARLQSFGVPADKITELGWGDATEVGGVRLVAEEALHYSARWRNDRNKTLWAAFVLEGAGKRLYWSGDSGYGAHFADTGRKYGGFDLAFMEIDAANPGWPKTHMFPEQALQATQDLKAARMVPMHWGVFSLGRNPWDENIKRAHTEARAKGVPLDVPTMGERYTPETHRERLWWKDVPN